MNTVLKDRRDEALKPRERFGSEQMHLNDFFEKEEGILYGPDIAD